MGGVTLFDQDMNFVLLGMEMEDEPGGTIKVNLSERRGMLSEVDMRPYKLQQRGGAGTPSPQLLDNLLVYACSPQDYFEIMTTCVSLKNQPEFVNGEPSREQFLPLFVGKRAFFQSIREKDDLSDSRYIHVSVAGGIAFTLADLCLVFNPGSLALLSIPAFLVMSSNTGFCPVPGQTFPMVRWLYRLRAPGGIEIANFDDYYDAFLRGEYLKNNSDLFLTTYALAHAIAVFAEDIQNYDSFESATSFRDYFDYEPLLYVLGRLVERGALRDPFGGEPAWKTCDTGVENAQEVNPDLAATLRLTEMLAPIATTPTFPGAISQVFYGLIDVLPLREYFSIDRQAKFKYPALDDANQSETADDAEGIPF